MNKNILRIKNKTMSQSLVMSRNIIRMKSIIIRIKIQLVIIMRSSKIVKIIAMIKNIIKVLPK